MNNFARFAVMTVLAFLMAAPGIAETAPTDIDPAMDEVFGDPADARPAAPKPRWRPGHGTVVWIDDAATQEPVLMEFNPISGERRVLLDRPTLIGAWSDLDGEPPTLEDPIWRPDGNSLVLINNGDPIIYDFQTATVTLLDNGAGVEKHAAFAPDGRKIAWVRNNDLWVYDLEQGHETRLTEDGSETVFNGVFDWVYEEELAGREGSAFSWSEDGSGLIWLRLDDGQIPVYHLVDLMETRSRVIEQRYPNPGDLPPRPSLHAVVFNSTSGASNRVSISFADPHPYIPRFGFTPDRGLWYQKLDRPQNTLNLVEHDPESRTDTIRIDETDPFWIHPMDGIRFLDDGSFLWLSRRSGHTHLYRIGADGAATDLTPDQGEVTEIIGVDVAGRFAWYQAAYPRPLERRVFRVDLGTKETTELTPASGVHNGELDPATGKLLINSSSIGTPHRWKVVEGDGTNAAAVPVEYPIPRIDYANHRFVQVTADDGIVLDAMLLLPPGFDENRRYPVVVYTYGGPNAQVVIDSWPRSSGLFNHVLAGRGFVVFALDNRGAAGRGRAFEGAMDHGLGSKQLADQLAGVKWLSDRPWVDADRIGIWGWSYGGYMACFALTHAPGIFAAGAAVAPVTDWRLYDSIYTERYMGTPTENPAGYAAGSVLDAVGELVEPLLVIHGTGDDNVHVQHSLQLADRAWREGVRFDLMLFPNLTHGINTTGSHRQVFGAIAGFFEEHLVGTRED